jgi:hypothetical protein
MVRGTTASRRATSFAVSRLSIQHLRKYQAGTGCIRRNPLSRRFLFKYGYLH